MKYIMFKNRFGVPLPVMFAAPETHADLAKVFGAVGLVPQSAGFVQFLGDDRIRCYGRADSLNLMPAPGDELLIASFMRATARLSPPPQPTPAVSP